MVALKKPVDSVVPVTPSSSMPRADEQAAVPRTGASREATHEEMMSSSRNLRAKWKRTLQALAK